MLPYLTLYRFSVSPTHYPKAGWPVVKAVGQGQFAVTDYNGKTIFGEGDAHHAVELFLMEIARMKSRRFGP